MNEFSVICRILGSLYCRHPEDPLLTPLFTLLGAGKLQSAWPLEQDELLTRLQQQTDRQQLAADYMALFEGDDCRVSPYASHWPQGAEESAIRQFLQTRGMSLAETPADHIGQILLAASWLEDHAETDESQAQIQLFDDFLLPWCGGMLGKQESHAATVFYRTLAAITREAIQAMREELAETADSERGER